jgi:hypothetical protein
MTNTIVLAPKLEQLIPACGFRVTMVDRDTGEATPLPRVVRAYADKADYVIESPAEPEHRLLGLAHEKGESADRHLAVLVENLDVNRKLVRVFAVWCSDADWEPAALDTRSDEPAVDKLRLRDVTYGPETEDMAAILLKAWEPKTETATSAADAPAPVVQRQPIVLVLAGGQWDESGWDVLARLHRDYNDDTMSGKVYAFSFANPDARLHVLPLTPGAAMPGEPALVAHYIYLDDKSIPPLTLLAPKGMAIDTAALAAALTGSKPAGGTTPGPFAMPDHLAAIAEALPVESEYTILGTTVALTLRKAGAWFDADLQGQGPTLLVGYVGRTHEDVPRYFDVLVPIPDLIAVDAGAETIFEGLLGLVDGKLARDDAQRLGLMPLTEHRKGKAMPALDITTLPEVQRLAFEAARVCLTTGSAS